MAKAKSTTDSVRDEYAAFLYRKSQLGGDHGFAPVWMPGCLFDFQAAIRRAGGIAAVVTSVDEVEAVLADGYDLPPIEITQHVIKADIDAVLATRRTTNAR